MQGTNLKDVCNKNCATTISSSKTVFRFFRPITLFWRTSPLASSTSGPGLSPWPSNLCDSPARTSAIAFDTYIPPLPLTLTLRHYTHTHTPPCGYSLTHSPTHSLTHSLSHPCGYFPKVWRVSEHPRQPNHRARHHRHHDFPAIAATRYAHDVPGTPAIRGQIIMIIMAFFNLKRIEKLVFTDRSRAFNQRHRH